MKSRSETIDSIELKRSIIIRSISKFHGILAIITFPLLLMRFFALNSQDQQHLTLLNIGFGILALLMSALLNYLADRQRSQYAAAIIVTFFALLTVMNFVFAGTSVAIPYMTLFVSVLCAAILISGRTAVILFTALGSFAIGISVLQYFGLIRSYALLTLDMPLDTVILIIVTVFGLYMTRLGFASINQYIEEATRYQKELEQANRNLEKAVELRTQQLKESLETQGQALYSSAIPGSILGPLLHDISSPVSILNMAFPKLESENATYIENSTSALRELNELIKFTNSSLHSQGDMQTIDTRHSLEKIIKFSRYYALRNSVRLTYKNEGGLKIKGDQSSFFQVVLNLIIVLLNEFDAGAKERTLEVEVLDSDRSEIRISTKGFTRKPKLENLMKDETNYSRTAIGLRFSNNLLIKDFGGEMRIEQSDASVKVSVIFNNFI